MSHAKISPSSLNYRAQCRAYAPTQTDSAAAAEGTMLHAAIEREYYDALDPEQLELVERCLRFLEPMKSGADVVRSEVKLNIKLGRHHTFGTADVVIVKGKLGYLVDFKFGRNGVPDAHENLQVLAYAVGVFDLFHGIEELQVWFLLPRRNETTSCTLSRTALSRYRKTLATLYDEVTATSPPQTPCAACQYCNQQSSCVALAGSALTLGRRIDPLVIPDEADPSAITPEVLDTVALPLARVLGSWCEKVKRRATQLAIEGHEFEHHKLVSRTSSSQIDDVETAYHLVSDVVPLEEFLKATKLSPAQLRSVAKALAPRGKGKAAIEEINSRLAALLPDEDAKTQYLRKK